MKRTELERRTDRLYAEPPAGFVAARNELARELRTAGDRRTADEVKGLAKPSATAWAVNALYHRERRRFDELLAAGKALRAAMAGKGDRRPAEESRRRALRSLLRTAEALLAEAGHAATPAARQRVSHTLEALAARDPKSDGPRPGRLSRDLEPQGFDVLASLAASLASAPAAPGTVAAKPRRSKKKPAARQAPAAPDPRLEAARQALAERRAELEGHAGSAREAEEALAAAGERRRALAAAAAEAEREARRAAAEAETARQAETEARAAATRARAGLRRAKARLETARRKLERLGGG